MAAILLYDSDPQHQQQVKNRLQKQGHQVWLADRLDQINTILRDVAINLMILDVDQHDLDLLTEFADRWRGIKIVFQASDYYIKQDFRTWMADDRISKNGDSEQVTKAVSRLLNGGYKKINFNH